ncbi:MAG: hypothetical protein ACP5U0_08125 [Caldisphaera sp.]
MEKGAKQALFLVLFISIIMVVLFFGTTWYYYTYYHEIGPLQLPKTFVTAAFSIFNGYSEMLSVNKPQEGYLNTLLSFGCFALAEVAIFLLSWVIDISKIHNRSIYRYWNFKTAYCIFLIALLSSQYVLVATRYINGGTLSGVSMFAVDSAFFSLFMLIPITIVAISNYRKIEYHPIIALVLAVYSLIDLLVSGLTIINDLNMKEVGNSYFVHIYGLLIFIVLYVFFYLSLFLISKKSSKS